MNNLLALDKGNNLMLAHLERSHKINRHTGIRASITPSFTLSDVGFESSSLPAAFGRQKTLLTVQFK